MNSATSAQILELHDRCFRAPWLAKSWERNNLSASQALYAAVEEGLQSDSPDPGQLAGDELFTLASTRGLDIAVSDLYGAATHLAAIADLVTWVLRPDKDRWERPADVSIGREPWVSCAFVRGNTSLRRVVLCDRWDGNRQLAEEHSWRTIGEIAAYGLPMTLMVAVLGSTREGRRHGPWSKAWEHPISHGLRMKRRDGKGFSGDWNAVFREDTEYSREKWLDQMTQDGVLVDALITHEVAVPEYIHKVRKLAEKKLSLIREMKIRPDPQISACDGPFPCSYREACWNFTDPCEKLGFIQIKPQPLPSPSR